ncbi:MAG TPA: exopolysaccharide biosynthesis polyprenyl glycosylphosphotransferase [Acetobacteraceae bacterium]|nr:exopolysaccharide biosynthesis polyprenyl glycosylphosphotransferase [Acetobacteraceae bacterium]
MSRIVAQYVPIEIALLGLFELILSFALIYAMLSAPGGLGAFALAPPKLSHGGINIAALLALTIAGTAATIGLYRPAVCVDGRRLLISATVTGIVAFPAVLLVCGGLHVVLSGHAVAWLSQVIATWLLGILIVRLVFSGLVGRRRLARRLLIIGTQERADRLLSLLRGRGSQLFEPVIMPAGPAPLTFDTLHGQNIWGVVVAGNAATSPDDPSPQGLLLDSKLRGIRVFSATGFQERHLGRIDLDAITESWLLFADGFRNGYVSNAVKRVFDICSSLLLLLLTLPLMAVTALAIKIDSRGPVFYGQQRAGLHGRPFTLFKFRSMAVDAEAGGKPRWAQKHDPRITRVGSVIRSMRIDELPQLLNVLRGEMSMIGPRPERPHFVEQLAKVIPFYNERSYAKPGVTGWAQVNFPYGASVEDAREKLAYDLYYAKNRSFFLDLLIMAATVRVVLFREGAR